jgi:hypothetical protein
MLKTAGAMLNGEFVSLPAEASGIGKIMVTRCSARDRTCASFISLDA